MSVEAMQRNHAAAAAAALEGIMTGAHPSMVGCVDEDVVIEQRLNHRLVTPASCAARLPKPATATQRCE
jgi:hypothetical protein